MSNKSVGAQVGNYKNHPMQVSSDGGLLAKALLISSNGIPTPPLIGEK
eukprot:CAMPEP_0176378376 /NCGR_PEP_ID=MMETSP0126-20121128/29568_1 /TAXON_ID=141414 ORGANISM="Strombidinopsis acuminatum, Strain SPMC142" /NCGR_SAMPLE_ID=MMETSP0126 /ASSEMBLY_ACC=CAM_ASM_000229 /LENGTH=47 /DNA_ID= /DNA_START= /DNA_END= /DNA_ORIENTATION=